MTWNRVRVLTALLEGPLEGMYGLELAKVAGVGVGSIYPTLKGMLDAGWVGTRTESGDPAALGRPLRTFYSLTPDGVAAARDVRSEVTPGVASHGLIGMRHLPNLAVDP